MTFRARFKQAKSRLKRNYLAVSTFMHVATVLMRVVVGLAGTGVTKVKTDRKSKHRV